MIKISGHSDDIVMVEADSTCDEFYPRDDERPFYLAVSNGMLIRVGYDGRWNINVDFNPHGIEYDVRRATDDETDYSDVLIIKSAFDWVVGGQDRL